MLKQVQHDTAQVADFMKKVLLFLAPFLIAIIIFAAVTYFLNRNSGKGALQVTSVPKSNVYLNGKLLGNTPFCMGTEKCAIQEMIEVGEYAIKLVSMEGSYSPYEAKISINNSTLTVVDRTFLSGASSSGSIITLFPISDKKDAELLVISFPEAAGVFLDNNQAGLTPVLLKNVTESDHDLQISKEGYFNKILKIRTVLGYKLEALVSLGINPNFSSPSASLEADEDLKDASQSGQISKPKIVILNTPTGFLRVREEASIASGEIGRVKPSQVYEFMEEKEGWFKIKVDEDIVGWVSAQYSKKQ